MLHIVKRPTDPDIKLLQAGAAPTRLAILHQLSSDGAVCACDLTACCTVHQPTVSHHLRVLREAGWVRAERHGTNISYELCADAVERFRQIAVEFRPGVERSAIGLSVSVPRMGSRLDRQAGPGRAPSAIPSRTRPTASVRS